jgi:hypothetical protein
MGLTFSSIQYSKSIPHMNLVLRIEHLNSYQCLTNIFDHKLRAVNLRGKTIWQKRIKCQEGSDAIIEVHITGSERKQLIRMDRKISYINPNRIGIDFDNFNGDSHDYIPNLSVADLVQLINRLHLLQNDHVRNAIKKRDIDYVFGVEFDSRRKIDFGIAINHQTDNEQVVIEYEDPLREIKKFEIGRIDVDCIYLIISVLKEVYLEYNHVVEKALLLGELT